MCEFVSFVVHKNGNLYFGTLNSHSGIEAGWDLKPGDYREAEWTSDLPCSLIVRGDDDNWYKSAVLAKYHNRQELLDTCIVGKTNLGTYYYKDGKRRRDDGPAVIEADGRQEFWRNGNLHRDDGPAIIRADGSQEFWKDGKRHRDDGPAVIWANGSQGFWKDGKLHRDDGPAVIWANGSQEFWKDGKRIK